MTDSVPQHNLPPSHVALHLLCEAVDPFTNHPQLYTSAACQHLPGALTRPACNEKLSLLASTQQVYRPLGQLLGNATDLVVRVTQTQRANWKKAWLVVASTGMWWTQKSWQKKVKKVKFYAHLGILYCIELHWHTSVPMACKHSECFEITPEKWLKLLMCMLNAL